MAKIKYPVTSEGQRIIAELGLSAGQLGTVADCSRAGAQKWMNGTAVPNEERKRALEQKWPELKRDTWSQPPKVSDAPTAQRPPRAESSLTAAHEETSPAEFIDARTSAKAHLAEIQRMMRDARKEERVGDVMKLMDLERRAIMDLAKFSGELTATEESKLTETRRWQEIREIIVKAIVPYPDAAKAVMEALKGIRA